MPNIKINKPRPAFFCHSLQAGLLGCFAVCILHISLFSQTSSATASLPSKSDVLAAIAIVEDKLPDPSASKAAELVAHYASSSTDVNITLSSAATPWMSENGGLEDPAQLETARMCLIAAYWAGDVKSQLAQKSKKKNDDPRAGWLTVIRVHERFPSQNLGTFRSVQRLAQLEKMGLLAEYADILKQEEAAGKSVPSGYPKIPAKERLTRDYLNPAHAFVTQGKYKEACAIYNAWLAQNPDDADVHFDYAHALGLEANAANNSKDAKAALKAARPHVLKAAVFGCDNPLLGSVLAGTDPNAKPGISAFSDNKKANEAIQRAEKAFAQRRFDDAINEYKQALKYDPKSYTATLFVGDCYFAQGKYADAIPWFEKAIALDPDRETAHRYMADALLKQGKPKEAIVKHIDALIAEPANKLPRTVMQSVAKAINPLYKPSPINKLPMGSVAFDPKTKAITLGLDPATQGVYVTGYLLARGAWISEHGASYFSKGTQPHHCAAEEMEGLSLFSKIVFEKNEQKDPDASDWLAAAETIRRLEEAGLLEAFVYIDRMDADIAKDYPAYREKNRDKLVRYIREFWLGEETETAKGN